MAIRSSATNTGSSSTSVIGNLPAGTTTGDLLLAFVTIRTRSITWTPPSGWTEIYHQSSGSGPQNSIACFWLAAGASEPSTYTFTASAAGSFQTLLVAMTGMNTTTPVDVSATGFQATTASPAAPSVTTTLANDVLFCQYATDATTSMTAATGQTIIDTPTSQLVVTDSETIASPSSTGTRVASGTSLKYSVASVALAVAASSGATVNATVATQGALVSPAPAVTGGASLTAPVGTAGAVKAPSPAPTWVVVAAVGTQGSIQPNIPAIAWGSNMHPPVVGAGSVTGVVPNVAGIAPVFVNPPPATQGSISGNAPLVYTPDALVVATVGLLGAIQAMAPTPLALVVTYYFTPPTTKLHYGDWKNQPLTSRIGIPTGATVLKTAGFYTINWGAPSQADINAADVVYLGGHTYAVSQAEAAALTAAGYGANITNG